MAVLSIKGSIHYKIRTGKGLGSFCNFSLFECFQQTSKWASFFLKSSVVHCVVSDVSFILWHLGTASHFYFKIIFFLFVFIASIGCSSKNFKLLACGIWLHSKEISGRCSCWSNKNKAALGLCEVRGRKEPLRTRLSGQPQWTQRVHSCPSVPSLVESFHSFMTLVSTISMLTLSTSPQFLENTNSISYVHINTLLKKRKPDR